MIKLYRCIILSAVLISFFSCASIRRKSSELNPVYVTDSKKIRLLAPSDFERPVSSLQFFSGTFGDKTFDSQLYIEADDFAVTLVILNEFGIEAGSLIYDGTSCILKSALFPPHLKSEYIVCDLQNAYCTKESLEKNYESAGLNFLQTVVNATSSEYESCRRREIYDGKNLIEQIDFETSKSGLVHIIIKNYLRGYTYELTEAAQ